VDKMTVLNGIAAISSMNDKFQYIINLAKAADGLDDSEKVHKYKIRGCNSKLWLVPKFENGLVEFRVDGEAMIPKGIGIILALAYSGMTPDEVIGKDPIFLTQYGITHHLTASRRNVLSGLYKQMKYYASAYKNM
jgi:cysteine desulfuration protein SufE